jgi:hypothetical protein
LLLNKESNLGIGLMQRGGGGAVFMGLDSLSAVFFLIDVHCAWRTFVVYFSSTGRPGFEENFLKDRVSNRSETNSLSHLVTFLKQRDIKAQLQHFPTEKTTSGLTFEIRISKMEGYKN